jgi:sulfur oxidation c-type cytochrome SoxX
MRLRRFWSCAPLVLAAGCAGFPDAPQTQALGEQMVGTAYPGMPAALVRRSHQDASQVICSAAAAGAGLTAQQAETVIAAARASVRYPASGRLVGDWKTGEALALEGAGGRIRGGQVEKVRENGANCYACHALAPTEVNAGNLGPSLTGYGRQRGNSEAIAKYTYDKIYNAWAFVPCSNMPRLGANAYLTPEQITHVVAFLLDPQSPVNRP